MRTIYCISGLGADERVFNHIEVPGHVLRPLSWKVPLRGEAIQAYAQRMAESIDEPNPVLMGLSFGGIMSIEIAKLLPVDKVILVSSVKSMNELPRWMRWVGRVGLNRVVPLKSFKITQPIQNYKLGVTNQVERRLAIEYRQKANQQYINWAVNQVLNWKNDWQPERLYHIHGTQDRMFPIKKVKASYVVEGGGHFMIMNKADEINRYLQSILG